METLQTGLRGVFRVLIFLIYVSGFLLVGYFIHFTTRDLVKRRARFMCNGLFTIRLIVRTFNINVRTINRPNDDETFLLVSNHMGFIDILALASRMPSLFVTSQEMRETPVLGLLTEMAGCIYVERRSKLKTIDEMKNVAEAMKQGFRIVLYPEATSTNGEQVLPFKRTLMMAAAEAGVPIQPVVINFDSINGEEFNLKWRDHVCWYGDMPFYLTAWRAMTLKSLNMTIEYLDKIYPQPDEDRAVVANKAHALISAKFIPVKQTT